MAPAFVPGPAVAARTAFNGTPTPICRSTPAILTMSAAPLSRRQALSAAAALVAGAVVSPLAASAARGDSPKISIFGVGGASSPFTAGIQKGGVVQYSKSFTPAEIDIYKRIIADSKDRLDNSIDSIKSKSWEDVRGSLRLEASDLRKTQITVNNNIADKKQAESAVAAYKVFKNDLENLDQACIQKNQDKAYKARDAAMKSLLAWETTAGF